MDEKLRKLLQESLFVDEQTQPDIPLMLLSGINQAHALMDYYQDHAYSALMLAQSLLQQYGEEKNTSALYTLTSELYDQCGEKLPAAFHYFSQGIPKREEYLLAFCDGLAGELYSLIFGEPDGGLD